VDLLDALTVAPASLPCLLNLYNRAHWPRADEVATSVPVRVSVLIPARNEEANVERCVRAALASVPPVHEVIVCDDASTDATPRILARLAAEDDRLRVIGGGPLPEGWIGKPWACDRLARAAGGDLLVFVDADCRLAPDGIARAWALLERYRAQVVTFATHQETVGLAERLIIPLLVLTYRSWMPLDLVWKHVDPRLLVANGQVLAIRRGIYERIGGHAAVRDDIVDDMAITRRVKQLDERVLFADGEEVATTRMYRGAGELWRGFSKNVYPGLGSPLALGFVVVMWLLAWVLPYARLAVELATTGVPSPAPVLGVALTLVALGVAARRHGHALLSVVLHPLSVLAFVAIALNSALWSATGRVRWRDRVYDRTTRAA
jgi:chlorobactene glucosyltransferase